MFAAILLTLALVFYRVIAAFYGDSAGLSNFSPMAAVVLCSAIFLPMRIALPLAFGSLLISDIILNMHYGVGADIGFFAKYAAFALVFAFGTWYRRKSTPALPGIFASVLGGAIVFYLISNTGAWITSPAYAKTFGGWLQALTVGVPGFPPTWTFFRNSLAGDLVFTTLFVLCVRPVLFGMKRQTESPLPANR